MLLTVESRWLYTLFLMVDANFKLLLKDKGIEDIELAPGWAYFVNDEKYQAHLNAHHTKHGDKVEVGRFYLAGPITNLTLS